MKKIIISGKGGSGKTTILSLVVVELLRKSPELNILVIDADPSQTLSDSLDIGNSIKNLKPIGELNTLIPNDWTYSDKFFQSLDKLVISNIKYGNIKFDYAYMGSHTKNSCMCSYNNSLNYLLKYIDKSRKYDFIMIDREAGVEHINRSVYGNKNDKLIIVSWPTSEYIQIAKQILDLANILGTTSQRFLVINNTLNVEITPEEILNYLKKIGISENINFCLFPYLEIFDKLRKLTAHEIISKNHNSFELYESLNKIISFIIN